MKSLLKAFAFTWILASCSSHPHPAGSEGDFAQPTMSPIDLDQNSASIEDYIISLPPYRFHEETVAEFRDRVRNSRTKEPNNHGRGRDSLYVEGDGTWPSKDFLLDRKTRTLRILIYGDPDESATEMVMRRVTGSWQQGP